MSDIVTTLVSFIFSYSPLSNMESILDGRSAKVHFSQLQSVKGNIKRLFIQTMFKKSRKCFENYSSHILTFLITYDNFHPNGTGNILEGLIYVIESLESANYYIFNQFCNSIHFDKNRYPILEGGI